MLKRAFGACPARVSLVFVGLMWVLPFLDYRHIAPISSFYQEWGAAMLGLCAMFLLVTRRKQPEIPRVVLLPIGLSLLVLLQFAAGKVGYWDQALLAVLYLLWAALLIMLGRRLRDELDLPALVTVLAAFLLLGAELNASVGVFQHYFWRTHPEYLFLGYLRVNNFSGNIAGAMAQANQFADYITLGLVSLGLLYLRWQMRVWQVALLAAPLLFVLVLSGSRSPWLYLLCMAGMSFLWRRRDKSNLPLLHYSLLLLPGFGLMHFMVQLPWLAASHEGLTSGERLIAGVGSLAEGSSGSIRLHLWREAWLIFTQFPLLGAGFGQFAWQHFQLGSVLRNVDITGMYDYAHNLVMQIVAEMGLSGLFVLLGTLALWFRQARAEPRTIYHWWGYGLLAVLAIHSMLEYPLWYAYFLGVAALTLGVFDSSRLKPREKHPLPEREGTIASSPQGGGLRRGLVGRLSVAAMLLVGLLSLSQMLYLYGYRNFELSAGVIHANATDNSSAQRARIGLIRDNMAAVQGRSLLLRPYVESFLGETGWDHVADKGALNGRVMRYKPFNAVVYRQALLLARLGQQAEARVQMERAIWAYPEDFPAALGQLRALAGMDTNPARFPALLEFSLQKYEERQLAVRAKS